MEITFIVTVNKEAKETDKIADNSQLRSIAQLSAGISVLVGSWAVCYKLLKHNSAQRALATLAQHQSYSSAKKWVSLYSYIVIATFHAVVWCGYVLSNV